MINISNQLDHAIYNKNCITNENCLFSDHISYYYVKFSLKKYSALIPHLSHKTELNSEGAFPFNSDL